MDFDVEQSEEMETIESTDDTGAKLTPTPMEPF